MNPDCDICRGVGKIALPVTHRRAVIDDHGAPHETSRSYPCPECGDGVPHDRVVILRSATSADARISDPGYTNAVKKDLASLLARGFLEKGLIQFTRGQRDDRNMTYPVEATLGVVSPRHVATMEHRIAERQAEVAREVMDEACEQIAIWNRDYTGAEGHIRKGQAAGEVQRALATVLARRAAKKVVI